MKGTPDAYVDGQPVDIKAVREGMIRYMKNPRKQQAVRKQDSKHVDRILLHALVNWRRKGGSRRRGGRGGMYGQPGYDPARIHCDDLRGYKRTKLNKPSRRDRRHPRRTP